MNSNFAVQPAAVAESSCARCQAVQVGSFGMTERGTVCTARRTKRNRCASRAGRPLPGLECASSIRSRPDVHPVFAARCWCAATACSRAITRTRKNRSSHRPRRLVHTGDIGSLDDMAPSCFTAGTRHAQGRRRERGRRRIEALLGRHPSVKLAQVVAFRCQVVEVPRRSSNSNPATTPPRPTWSASARAKCGFKCRVIRFVDDWPMSSSKIQKIRLREALVAELVWRSRRADAADATFAPLSAPRPSRRFTLRSVVQNAFSYGTRSAVTMAATRSRPFYLLEQFNSDRCTFAAHVGARHVGRDRTMG